MVKKKEKRARALAARPETRQDERQRGLAAFAREDYDGAIYAWTAALRTSPSAALERALAEAHFRRACTTARRLPERAVEDLRTACDLQPTEARYHYHLGLALHRRHEYAQAIAAYRVSLQHSVSPHDDSRVAPMLCLALAENGQQPDLDPAWLLLTPAQQEQLRSQDETFRQALEYLEAGQFADAEPLLHRSLSRAHRGLAHYYLGVAAWRRGASDEALAAWLSARAAGFNTPGLRQNLAVAYIARANKHLDSPELAEIVRAGLRLSPESPILLKLKQRYEFLEGNQAAIDGNWRAALAHWQTARQISAQQPGQTPRELLWNMAIALEHLERWPDAAEMWREVIRRRPRKGEHVWTPQHVAALWRHIDTLYARAGLLDQAVTTLRYAIKAQPDDLALRLALARRHAENLNWQAAEGVVLAVLEAAPQHPEAIALYAEILDVRGDLDLAIEAWERVVSLHDLRHLATARQRLLKLYGERSAFYESIDDYAAAEADLAHAVAIAPEDAVLQARYGAAMTRTRPEAARGVFERLDLSDTVTGFTVINAWHRSGQHDEAARWLDRVLARCPEKLSSGASARLLVQLGATLFADSPGLATAYFERAMAMLDGSPTAPSGKSANGNAGHVDQEAANASLLTTIAVTYAAHGQAETAYDYARRALRLQSGFGPAHLNLGLWDAAHGRRQAANEHMRQALRWAQEIRRPDVAEGIKETMHLLAERVVPTLEEVLETIDPSGEDEALRRLMGSLDLEARESV